MVLGQEHRAGDRLDRLDDGGDGALDLDALGEPGAAGDRVAACAEREDADQLAGDLVDGILTVRDGAAPDPGVGHRSRPPRGVGSRGD